MLQIISVYNIKGGVGKTTTAVNLAYLAAAAGWRTLLWDLDPQGASTYTLRVKPKIKGGVEELIDGERELRKLVKNTEFDNYDLLPSDFSYRRMDNMLDDYKKATKVLLKLLRPLRKKYDYLFIDCPPGMTLVSENVVRAADGLVIPLLPSPFSVQMLEMLTKFINKREWHDMALLPFFSMVDRRKKLHKDVMENLRRDYPEILETYIPYSSPIEQMSVRRAPIPSYAPSGPATLAYEDLLGEIQRALGKD